MGETFWRSKGVCEIRARYLPCTQTLTHPAPGGPVPHEATHALTHQPVAPHIQDPEL